MQTVNYKKQIIISLAIAILFLLVEVILFWNLSSNESRSAIGIWPFLCVIVVILAIGYALNVALKATNTRLINEMVEQQVSEERLKILKEFEKKDEIQEQTNDEEIIENKLKDIVPKGNFKNIDSLLNKYFKNLAAALEIVQGILYLKDDKTEEYIYSSGYALTNEKNVASFKAGETLPGKVAQIAEISYVSEIPDEYFQVESGLGKAKPKHLIFVPVQNNDAVIAIIEFAVFKEIKEIDKEILSQSIKEISQKVAQTIKS